jgi:mono/diheme cytochrome c family protein
MRLMRLAAALAAAIAGWPAAAAGITTAQGVYSAAQAAHGKEVYLAHCATACHQPGLTGSGPAPDLAGPDFMARWEDLSLADLQRKIAGTMPLGKAGSLPAEDYLAVIAYLLAENGFPAADTGLKNDPAALGAVSISRQP